MDRIRARYPCHIPCRFILPDCELKLLLPIDATAGHALAAVRQRWKTPDIGPTDALFAFVDNRIVCGNKRLTQLDTCKPGEVVFYIRKENTFGSE